MIEGISWAVIVRVHFVRAKCLNLGISWSMIMGPKMWPYWPRNPKDRHSFNLRGYKLWLHCATLTRRTLAETYTITGTMKNISGRPLMTGTSHTSKRKPHRSCDLKIKDRSYSYLRNNASYGPQKVRHKNPAIAGGQRKEPIDHLVPQRNPTIIWREGQPHMLV